MKPGCASNTVGNSSFAISSITTSGDFIQTNNCGSSLNAGANCTISVTFKPGAAGISTGTLSISEDPSGRPQTVALRGTSVVSTAAPHPAVPSSAPEKPPASD